jgi:hypothetical protein
MRQNLLLSANDLRIGDTIIIPGAKKEIPKPVVVPKKTYVATTNTPANSGYQFAAKAKSEYVNTG